MADMDMIDKEKEYFRRAIQWFADETDEYGGQTGLSHMYGCKNQYINMVIRGKSSLGYKVQQKFAKVLNKTREDIIAIGKNILLNGIFPEHTISALASEITFTGAPSNVLTTPCPACNITDETNARNQIVITGLKDKELTIRLNQKLVEIEQLAPDSLSTIETVMDGLLSAAREKKGLLPSQNQSHPSQKKNGTTGQEQK